MSIEKLSELARSWNLTRRASHKKYDPHVLSF
jgi:hypothetical protein